MWRNDLTNHHYLFHLPQHQRLSGASSENIWTSSLSILLAWFSQYDRQNISVRLRPFAKQTHLCGLQFLDQLQARRSSTAYGAGCLSKQSTIITISSPWHSHSHAPPIGLDIWGVFVETVSMLPPGNWPIVRWHASLDRLDMAEVDGSRFPLFFAQNKWYLKSSTLMSWTLLHTVGI